MSKKATFVLIDDDADDAVETKTTKTTEKKKSSNIITILAFGFLAAVLHNYYGDDAVASPTDAESSAYASDIICMGALSIARDETEYTNRSAFMEFTNIQNQYYLKYEGGISDDVATAKAVLIAASQGSSVLISTTVAKCIK